MIDTYEKFLAWIIIVLIIQSFLCFKVKSRIIRLLPIILCLLFVIGFIIRIAITPPGWERFGCLLMIIQAIRTESKRLIEMLANEDLSIYGFTPDLTTEEIRKTKKFSLVKAEQILLG